MKKFLALLAVAASFLFTSCVEIVQMVYMENGKMKTGVRLVVNQSLMQMCGMDENPFDFLDSTLVEKMEQKGVDVEMINNDSDIGFGLAFDVDADIDDFDTNGTLKLDDFIPKIKSNITGGVLEMSMGLMGTFCESAKKESSDSESQMYAKMMYDSMKYKMYVGKSVCKNIGNAYLVDAKGKKYPSDVYSVGDSYCIESSFSKFMDNDIKKLVITYY